MHGLFEATFQKFFALQKFYHSTITGRINERDRAIVAGIILIKEPNLITNFDKVTDSIVKAISN